MPDTRPPQPAQELASQVERDGGRVLAVYQEPVGDHWQIFCLLPRARCEASPYQRDLSPTHVKRLSETVKRLDRFMDPIVAVSPRPGVYWTPNGNHRRAVLDKLKAELVPAILVVEKEMLFEVLPLNVEKAHNLKEKSFEVIRMYRALVRDEPETTEEAWAAQFESAHFITLGLLYEENKRFAGGAFAPILRRVDKFLKLTLPKGLAERQERADLVRAADEALGDVVQKIKKRGINHPYVKNYVLARTTPLTRARKTLPPFDQTLTLRFLAEGAAVAVPYAVEREREQLWERVAQADRGRLVTEAVDATSLPAMTAFAERVVKARGRLDVLVAGVGGFAGGALVETDEATWTRMLHLNLTSAFASARAVVPHMLGAGYGRVVVVASRAVVPPQGGFIAYTVAKAGAIALVQALAQETRSRGVTVNAVLPSTMDTEANRAAMPDSDRKGWVPVDAVADAIAMLVRPASAHVTGTLLAI